MRYDKRITLRQTKNEKNPWLVNVAKGTFGNQIRRRFPNKKLAEAAVNKYEDKLRERERVPLDPEIHKVISNYQTIFSADELREILEGAVARKKLGDGTIGDFGDRYLAHKEDAFELAPLMPSYTIHQRSAFLAKTS